MSKIINPTIPKKRIKMAQDKVCSGVFAPSFSLFYLSFYSMFSGCFIMDESVHIYNI